MRNPIRLLLALVLLGSLAPASAQQDSEGDRHPAGVSLPFRTCAGICPVLCSTIAIAADAEPSPQTWLNAGFLSYHADGSREEILFLRQARPPGRRSRRKPATTVGAAIAR
jgi:hypothetical protein